MFERFTASARQVVVDSQVQARALTAPEIGAEHLLLALLEQPESLPARVLAELGVTRAALVEQVRGITDAEALRTVGVDLDQVRSSIEATFGPGALDRPRERRTGWLRRRRLTGSDAMRFGNSARKALELSLRQALALQHRHLGAEHVLLGLLTTDGEPAARVLQRLGVAPGAVRDRVRAALTSAA